jgi:hypothetical protein
LGKYRGSRATGMEVFKTYKQRGEWIELLFMTLAVKRGYVVLKPWGDSARYDVGIELAGRFMRIQVKGTDCRRWGGYTCILSGGRRRDYTTKQIDYFAIYVLEEDVWYIFPAKRLAGQKSVMLSPRRAKNPHARYKEAWDLLDPRKHVAVRGAEIAANKVLRKGGRPNRNGAAG